MQKTTTITQFWLSFQTHHITILSMV